MDQPEAMMAAVHAGQHDPVPAGLWQWPGEAPQQDLSADPTLHGVAAEGWAAL